MYMLLICIIYDAQSLLIYGYLKAIYAYSCDVQLAYSYRHLHIHHLHLPDMHYTCKVVDMSYHIRLNLLQVLIIEDTTLPVMRQVIVRRAFPNALVRNHVCTWWLQISE